MDHPTQSADDFAEHRRSYEGFIRIVVIVVFTLLAHVVALAIGGLAHLWLLAALALVLSIAAAIAGALVRGLDWKPELIVLVMLLMVLLFVTH
jgi:hypothetical protein